MFGSDDSSGFPQSDVMVLAEDTAQVASGEKDGTGTISPDTAVSYADRSANFPYKIDENDLCYKLFIQHGFTWGGNWNNVKDYQHFQKAR